MLNNRSSENLATRQADITVKYRWRSRFVFGLYVLAMASLVLRAAWLQFNQDPRLLKQLTRQHRETVSIDIARGRILDRRGEILASSAPVKSIALDLKLFKPNPVALASLAKVLDIPLSSLSKKVIKHPDSRYLLIKRRVSPAQASKVKALGYKGIVIDQRYDRYYPSGESSGHLVGFIDNAGHGKAGVEQIFDEMLQSQPGSYIVSRDLKRHRLENIKEIEPVRGGQDIVLGIDQRLQYRAYSELKRTMMHHQAKAASFVMLDINTGEILALANLPVFNPNDKTDRQYKRYRNRAITDVFEPGSTIKPFTIACALQAGVIWPDSEFDTAPGYMRVGRNRVRDTHNYKRLDTSGVLRKSSNVGTTQIALELEPKTLWDCFHRLQFDQKTNVDFPGAAAGSLPAYQGWGQFEQATHSFGYGLNTTLIQLAHAYAAIANNGMAPELSLLKQDTTRYTKMLSEKTADTLLHMMEQVVSVEGTARRARIPGYRVAGKTGTVRKTNVSGGYSRDNHLSLFVGIVPVEKPRFVAAVLVDDPQENGYYGGVVAAPVFANVMKQALLMYGISPDKIDNNPGDIPVTIASNAFDSH
ncbi:MAG: penicillin-binding protein 2 [Gammaproteobacteria bacterium]|nr:penicillin-binding protein 2 [Gammaproteobacteria bacterium]